MKYKQMLKIRKTEKDPQVRDRILLNVLVKRDGMSVTGAARLLGMAPSWGVKWHGRYLKEGIAGLRHDPQLRIGPSMPIILQMYAPKHATFV